MSAEILQFAPLDVDRLEVLLCDADGNLFGSEQPAFEASTEITNRLLQEIGVERAFSPQDLRRRSVGKNFRSTALELAAEAAVVIDAERLAWWVREEQRAVIGHLSSVLRPDPAVHGPLRALARRFKLAVVSSSAMTRLAACFTASDLDQLFPPRLRFSAEDSLPVPTSKPDPAVYAFAGQQLGIQGPEGLAVEDSITGARSAVAAGFPTVGNLQFVAAEEREELAAALHQAGVAAIVPNWADLVSLLSGIHSVKGPN